MDKSMMFKYFNFKLVVIEALLEKEPLFLKELTELRERVMNKEENKDKDFFDWYLEDEPIAEIKEYLENLILDESDLEKVDSLLLDGGLEIYHMLKPAWDGEDDLFDITSFDGFEHLKNLKTINYSGMCDYELLEPLEQAGIEIE